MKLSNKKFNKAFVFAKRKSFTLIEVLLAVFVLEIGLLGIAGFYSYSYGITKTARNLTIASNLAAGVLDKEMAITYDNLPNVPRQQYSETSPFNNWEKEVIVSCINDSLNPLACSDSAAHMKKIVVKIYWHEQQSDKSFEIATIKAEH